MDIKDNFYVQTYLQGQNRIVFNKLIELNYSNFKKYDGTGYNSNYMYGIDNGNIDYAFHARVKNSNIISFEEFMNMFDNKISKELDIILI